MVRKRMFDRLVVIFIIKYKKTKKAQLIELQKLHRRIILIIMSLKKFKIDYSKQICKSNCYRKTK